jgi:KaiC/GvpD/RAD55 family RecA-like ATPase
MLSYKLYIIADKSYNVLLLFTIFYAITHLLVNVALIGIITPIIGRNYDLFKLRYVGLYMLFLIAAVILNKIFYLPLFPTTTYFIFLYIYIFISLIVFSYFVYFIFKISLSYRNIGFINTPYAIAGFGAISLIISVSFVLFCFNTYVPAQLRSEFYFYIFFYLMSYIFSVTFYMRFVIGYPALLEPKWKALMPFDLTMATSTLTLAILTASIYATAIKNPNFMIPPSIPYFLAFAVLPFIFISVVLIFSYLENLLSKTKLDYWVYLRYGQYIHIIVTFYVISMILLSWEDFPNITKIFGAIFCFASFAFYLFFALDLHTILIDQNIHPALNRFNSTHYIVSLCSWFALIFLGVYISLTHGEFFDFLTFEFISYPIILFFIAFFLIAFGAYLSVTHKGFEEILGKNIWSEFSYIFAFIAFVLVYLIYSALGPQLQRFPYHNLAFLGYFVVLIIEIISTRTLAQKFEYKKARGKDLGQLLNFYAHNFLRTDYLEELWEKTVNRYVAEYEIKNIEFDPSRRRFNLEKLDEKIRLTLAVQMLLGMQAVPNLDRITLLRRSNEETKAEITSILEEKVLLLPPELRSEFDERLYYPRLFERTINHLLAPLKTFVPLVEQKQIFERLKRGEALFSSVTFGETQISLQEGTRFTREDFLKLFQRYLDAIEERFPFKRVLLYELVREEIKEELQRYGIMVGNVLDRVPTGLEEMDKIMAGGFVKGSSTLLLAEETKMKQKLLLTFIEHGLLEGNFAVYATSKHPYDQIMGELLMDVEELENLTILDLYENLFDEDKVSLLIEVGNRIIVPMNKILYQRSLVKVIKSLPHDVPKIVIIDAVDDFSRYYTTHDLFELLQKQLEGLKRWTCTSLIVMGPHSHLILQEGVDEVKKHFDNVLILSGDDKDASVLIEKLYHGTPSKHVVRL